MLKKEEKCTMADLVLLGLNFKIILEVELGHHIFSSEA